MFKHKIRDKSEMNALYIFKSRQRMFLCTPEWTQLSKTLKSFFSYSRFQEGQRPSLLLRFHRNLRSDNIGSSSSAFEIYMVSVLDVYLIVTSQSLP